MRAEDRHAHEAVITKLFTVVKELRFMYRQLFWNNKNQGGK